MSFRASFEGSGFSDRCLSIAYSAAEAEKFDPAQSWARSGRHVVGASDRVHFLSWVLRRAVADNSVMLAEFCASEIFRPFDAPDVPRVSTRKFSWYAERVNAARERLDREFAEDHSVADLARSVGMSAFHFARVFRSLVGRPPHAYLAEARLAAARQMLEEGMAVTDACFASGFNNLSHFSRRFAARYGRSPSRCVLRRRT